MYFRVYAIKGSFADGHIESEGSVKVDATPTNTPSGSAPSVPTGLTATAASSNSITISWSSVSGATDYYIYRSTVSSSSYTHVGDSPSTSFTNNGLSANTTYYYKVSAYNAYGESAQSSYVYETTRSSTSPAPLIGSLLARGIWRDGEIDGQVVWWQDYYFYATAGTSYTVFWNDAWNGDGTKDGKVEVYAYWYSDNEDIFWGDNYEDLGYRYGKTFTPSPPVTTVLYRGIGQETFSKFRFYISKDVVLND